MGENKEEENRLDTFSDFNSFGSIGEYIGYVPVIRGLLYSC